MENGCLGHPGASTSTASPQIEYRPHAHTRVQAPVTLKDKILIWVQTNK